MTFAPAPTPRDSSAGRLRRLELLDALRGFALAGTLMLCVQRVPLLDARWVLLAMLLLGGSTAGVLRESVAHWRFWRVLLVGSLVVTAGPLLQDGSATAWARALLRQAAPLSQGLFCVAAFVLLFQRAAWRRKLCKLSPMGRMAFTNCAVQGLVGLVLLPRLGLDVESVVGAAVLGAVIFALQAMASCWWMTRFHHGPLEWAWQRLAHARRSAQVRVRAVRGA
ncbi:DUF418 domain-containing protein [Variovorax sp. RCC_210]|uniref:DUF418 domain-containing protein n=1 Tax=Variovorax sp. RCC_210 TaxID=3239217 RepID=UPI0035262038